MTQFIIQSKGQYNGEPVEVSANVTAITVLDALKAYIDCVGKYKITLNHVTLTQNVKDSAINA